MSELEDTLSSVLSDPEQMARLRAMAQSLMGGAAQDSEPSAPAATPPSPEGLGLGQLGALVVRLSVKSILKTATTPPPSTCSTAPSRDTTRP